MGLEGVVKDYQSIRKGEDAYYDLYRIPLPEEKQRVPTPKNLDQAEKIAVLQVVKINKPPRTGMRSGSIEVKRYSANYNPYNTKSAEESPAEKTISLPDLGIGVFAFPNPNPDYTWRLVPHPKPPTVGDTFSIKDN